MRVILAIASIALVSSPVRAQPLTPVRGMGQPNSGANGSTRAVSQTSPPRQVPRMPAPLRLIAAPTTVNPALDMPAFSAAPALTGEFQGIAFSGFYPPDPILSVGPDAVLLVANGAVALASKTGSITVQRTLNAFFNGSLSSSFTFDPKTLYDPHSGRLFVSSLDGEASPSSFLRIAYSKSSSPMNLNVGSSGADDWGGLDIDADLDGGVQVNNNWGDFDSIGVDEFNLYVTANMFSAAGNFQYVKLWVIPKVTLLAGGSVTPFEFGAPPGTLTNPSTGFKDFTIQPALDFDTGGTHFLAENALVGGFADLTVWTVNTPGATPTLSAASLQVTGFPGFTVPTCAQPGGGVNLDTGDTRLMQVIQRNGRLWTAHTIPNTTATRSQVRWYEIDPSGPTVVQSGNVGDGSRCYFYPAIHPDGAGDAAMVFSGVGPSNFGSAYYTARLASDTPGAMQTVGLLKAGITHYEVTDSSGLNRWGDFGSIAADPTTDELWIMHEFASSTANQWSTWVGRLVVTPEVVTTTTTTTTTTTLPIPRPARAARLLLRDGASSPAARRFQFVTRDPTLTASIAPGFNGVQLQVFNADGGGDSLCLSLPPELWKTSGGGISRYLDPHGVAGPVRRALLRDRLFRVTGAGASLDYTLDEARQGRVGVIVTDGVFSSYCAAFGGRVRADIGGGNKRLFKAIHAPAPAVCPTAPTTCP